jgi:hypothetical protein
MASYILFLAGYVYDVTGIGLIGLRGRITLALMGVSMIVAAVAYCGWHTTGEAFGVLAGVLTVLGFRRLGRWLRDEGGALIAWEAARFVAELAARALADAVWTVLSSPARGDVQGPVSRAPEVVPEPVDPAQVALPHGDRWNLLGDPVEPPVTLHSVETYSDWLPTAVETSGGYNAAVRVAAQRFNVSRSTFVRDIRKIREEAA